MTQFELKKFSYDERNLIEVSPGRWRCVVIELTSLRGEMLMIHPIHVELIDSCPDTRGAVNDR